MFFLVPSSSWYLLLSLEQKMKSWVRSWWPAVQTGGESHQEDGWNHWWLNCSFFYFVLCFLFFLYVLLNAPQLAIIEWAKHVTHFYLYPFGNSFFIQYGASLTQSNFIILEKIGRKKREKWMLISWVTWVKWTWYPWR